MFGETFCENSVGLQRKTELTTTHMILQEAGPTYYNKLALLILVPKLYWDFNICDGVPT